VYEIGGKGEADRHVAVPLEEQRICGLRRKPFWIILVIAIVLVKGAVVGGVVGGVVKGKDSVRALYYMAIL
jgi:hypothetical protein